jgi:hypothetical protein
VARSLLIVLLLIGWILVPKQAEAQVVPPSPYPRPVPERTTETVVPDWLQRYNAWFYDVFGQQFENFWAEQGRSLRIQIDEMVSRAQQDAISQIREIVSDIDLESLERIIRDINFRETFPELEEVRIESLQVLNETRDLVRKLDQATDRLHDVLDATFGILSVWTVVLIWIAILAFLVSTVSAFVFLRVIWRFVIARKVENERGST